MTRKNTDPYIEEAALNVRPHHLLCAVCASAGCGTPPCGKVVTDEIRQKIKSDSYTPLRLIVDIDVARAHYNDLYLSENWKEQNCDVMERQDDYAARFRDLEVMRRCGYRPGVIVPAAEIVQLLFEKIESLEGICFHNDVTAECWPECPHARKDLFKDVRGDGKVYSLAERTELGETLEGKGAYSLLPIRMRAEMATAKEDSSKKLEDADRIFVLPAHIMCLVCAEEGGLLDNGPLAVDNLYEILEKMRNNPELPVTLVEGTCMVCDPCSGYHVERNLCLHGYIKTGLRNLMVLRKLGLKPGSTMKAKDLYKLIFERIKTAKEICGWGDMQSTSWAWSTCADALSGNYEKVRERGVECLFSKKNDV